MMARVTPIPVSGTAYGAKRPARAAFGRRVSLAAARLLEWIERARQRRALQRLDDRMLRDIGLSRADVDGEVDKPFWRQ